MSHLARNGIGVRYGATCMGLTERDLELYECSSCGGLGRQKGVTCCGEPRESVDATVTYKPPEVEAVVKEVFDHSSTDLAICSVLMAEDEATIKALATQLSLNRSTITRRLNHLLELGVVEKEVRNLREGGQVNVYSTAPIEDIHRTFQLGLYTWLDDAEELLDELHQERLERMMEDADVEATDESDTAADGDESDSVISRLFHR